MQVRAETAAVEAEARRATETARSQAGEALAAVDAQHRRADDAEAMSAELRGRLDELSAEHGRPPGRPTNAWTRPGRRWPSSRRKRPGRHGSPANCGPR